MQPPPSRPLWCRGSLGLLITFLLGGFARAGVVWPAGEWEARSAADVGLIGKHLDSFIRMVRGDGCIVKDGYLIRTWGNYTAQGDWASAAKPVLSTLLMLAVVEKRLPGVDAPVQLAGWKLREEDQGMTFRHLADMTSGFGRAEPPGAAWAYNDFAINLYAHSLKRIFGTSLDKAFTDRLAPLQFQDGAFFGSREGLGVSASPRDFARLGWCWLQRGNWRGRQIIPRKLFEDCVRPSVPATLPRTAGEGEDYLGIGSYGGGTDQMSHGPGVYGFNFWFNERVPGTRYYVWPSLPRDAYQANGMWNRHTVTVIPSWRMVVVVRNGRLGKFEPGVPRSKSNAKLALLRPTRSALLRGPHKN